MAILKDAPAGAQVLDLGAARAARAEARVAAGAPNPVLKLSAGYVEVHPEFSVTIGETLKAGEIREALQSLLVDPNDVDALIEEGISALDINEILTFLGASLGEATASSKR